MNLLLGDCRERLKEILDNSIHAVITDPPYELGFMGKSWDRTGIAYDEEVWKECLRVLKPGGYLLAFGGSRTYHRLASAVEDAGFEIRDQIMWVYGSGFPKSLDVSKAIDKRGGNPQLIVEIGKAIKEAREKRGMSKTECDEMFCGGTTNWSWFEGRPKGQRVPSVEDFAKIIQAWPELTVLAESVAEVEREVIGTKKSGIADGNRPRHTIGGSRSIEINVTVSATEAAKQWSGWGTALKPAHEPIVVARKPLDGTVAENVMKHGTGAMNIDASRVGERWPANFIHDGLEEPWAGFFYCAKASKTDRDEGLDGVVDGVVDGVGALRDGGRKSGLRKNNHPTVKPTTLMRYLCRLVTPPGGTVLDPFMGSGSTGKAASLEGFEFVGIEKEEEYFKIAKARINNATTKQNKIL